MSKKIAALLGAFLIACSLILPVCAEEFSVQSVPTIYSTVCRNCSVQMTHTSTSAIYYTSFSKTNISCPNSDVEEGSHEHRYYYQDEYYTCPSCGIFGVLKRYLAERCYLTGIGYNYNYVVPTDEMF